MKKNYHDFLVSKFDLHLDKCPEPQTEVKLPKTYKRLYDLELLCLEGFEIYCVYPKKKGFSLNDYNYFISLVDYLYPRKVCLCSSVITDTAKQKLVNKKINYLVLDSDIYFPDAFLMYTKSKFKDKDIIDSDVSFAEKLPPLSSKIVILYVQRLINKSFNSKDIYLKTDATLTAIANATNLLIDKNLLSAEKIGKSWEYTFKIAAKDLWALRENLLADPIRSRKILSVKDSFFSDNPLTLTGESAVSQYTLLSEPQTPIYGIDAKSLKEFEEKYCDENSNNAIILEVFSYPLLSKTISGGQVIDRMELVIAKPVGLSPRVAASYEEIEDEIMEKLIRYD